MKKFTAVAGVLLLSSSVFAACTPNAAPKNNAGNAGTYDTTRGGRVMDIGNDNRAGVRGLGVRNRQAGVNAADLRNDRTLESRVESIPGIRNATVLVAGNTAYVAIDQTPNLNRGTRAGTAGTGTTGNLNNRYGGTYGTGTGAGNINRGVDTNHGNTGFTYGQGTTGPGTTSNITGTTNTGRTGGTTGTGTSGTGMSGAGTSGTGTTSYGTGAGTAGTNNGVAGSVRRGVGTALGIGGAAGNAAGNIAGQTGNAVGNAVGNVGNAVGNAVGNTGNAVGNVVGNNAVGNTVGRAGNALGNVVGYTGNAVGNVVGYTGNAVGNVGNAVGNATNRAANRITGQPGTNTGMSGVTQYGGTMSDRDISLRNNLGGQAGTGSYTTRTTPQTPQTPQTPLTPGTTGSAYVAPGNVGTYNTGANNTARGYYSNGTTAGNGAGVLSGTGNAGNTYMHNNTDNLRNGTDMTGNRAGTMGTTNTARGYVVYSDAGVSGDIKSRIATIIRQSDATISKVYVSANPNLMNRMDSYVRNTGTGHPLQGGNDLLDTVRRMFPASR